MAFDPLAFLSSAPPANTAVAPARDRWDVFTRLGLGPPAELSKKSAKWMVSAYRLLGFIVLTIIVVVLVGYLATSAFYVVSDSWVRPTVVSATDERVLALQAQVDQHQTARDQLAAQLRHADRAIAMEQGYQAEFARAIRADLEGRADIAQQDLMFAINCRVIDRRTWLGSSAAEPLVEARRAQAASQR